MSQEPDLQQNFSNTDFIFSLNDIFIEELYNKYLENPASVDDSWRNFFSAMKDENTNINVNGSSWQKYKLRVIGTESEYSSLLGEKREEKKVKLPEKPTDAPNEDVVNRLRVLLLTEGYHRYGHLNANLDPLKLQKRYRDQNLNISHYGFEEKDLNKNIKLDGFLNINNATLGKIVQKLEDLYCGSVGVEFSYITSHEEKLWLHENFIKVMEEDISIDKKQQILCDLYKSSAFEQQIQIRLPGAKRFSIEGSENTLTALNCILETSSKHGVVEGHIGMAHRGRLNILTHILDKPYRAIFSEFMGTSSIPENTPGSGDVKYHLGYSKARDFGNSSIRLSLAHNPSHLETINSVIMGKVRARQELFSRNKNKPLSDLAYVSKVGGDMERKTATYKDVSEDLSNMPTSKFPTEVEESDKRSNEPIPGDSNKVMSILIHGDAAFIGQGSVAESLSMANLKGYDVGGTIHIIINNQVGFTANPVDTRSGTYASDIAKIIEAPIFHVNGDDAECVYKVAKLMANYRQKFKKDIVMDLISYRKYGHNEGDEPNYTQPVMYNIIKDKPIPADIYYNYLKENGISLTEVYEKFKKEIKDKLDQEYDEAKDYKPEKADWLGGEWKGFTNEFNVNKEVITGISNETIKLVENAITSYPKNFNINHKIAKLFEARKELFDKDQGLDWAAGELLAYGSLLLEGSKVRLCGQDVERGTFSHRHSVLIDAETAEKYYILNHIKDSQKAQFEVHNSLLSEFAALGFEYGYSTERPDVLTLWEAQFGDFANGAAVIYDQYISSAESKWLRLSGLVMLLPHGMEGQGPEHSSARLERYLQSAAENNVIVANCTTPANFFHILRRQIHNNTRKPLIIMTPKSLLRHKLAVSKLSEFEGKTSFKTIIGENDNNINKDKVERLVITSGKIYYDLYSARLERKINDVAIIRIEQYYPFDTESLKEQLMQYKNAKEVIWLQEESQNMGAWIFIRDYIDEALSLAKHKVNRVTYIGRKPSASPAVGFANVHVKEQQEIVERGLRVGK